MANLRLKNVNKTFPGGVQAVNDFNIEIKHGEFIVLVGPSGCGKTTVLRMIAGLETTTEGEMYLEDILLNDVAPADRDISMVFQNYALYGHMTAYQNMGFSQTIRHENSDTIHEKVMEAAVVVELEDKLNRYPRNLSGGQRQRVALGRAIVNKASIILMDEPLSNLDAKLRVQERAELIKLHKQLGNTFIYVTHDQTEAMTMADRIVVMNDGEIQQIGTPLEVYDWPENVFVSGFIGNPPMNLFRGTVEGDMFTAPGLALKIPEKYLANISSYQNESIILGIRPEHFSIPSGSSNEPVIAEISANEFLGDHSLVYLQIAGMGYVTSVKQKISQSIGDSLEVYFNMNRIYFFDPESGKRIHHEESKL